MATADKAYSIAAAAAQDLNDELTIILIGAEFALSKLEPGHPARRPLLDIQNAAQRCARKISGLLNHSIRHGGKASPAPMEQLIDNSLT